MILRTNPRIPIGCMTSLGGILDILDPTPRPRWTDFGGDSLTQSALVRILPQSVEQTGDGDCSEIDWVANQRACHAVTTTAPAAQLGADDGDHLDARLSQERVCEHVAVIGNDDSGL